MPVEKVITDNKSSETDLEFDLDALDSAVKEKNVAKIDSASVKVEGEVKTEPEVEVEEIESELESEAAPEIKGGEAEDEELDDPGKLTAEERTKFGQRAQKRIQRLVRERNEALDKVKAAEERATAAAKTATDQAVKQAAQGYDQQLALLDAHNKQLDAAGKEAKAAIRAAKEAGDIEKELEASENLASAKANQVLVQRATEHLKSQGKPAASPAVDSKDKESVKADTKLAPAKVAPDKRAVEWQRRNLWFGGDTHRETIMTQAAMDVHFDLVEKGINPVDDADEYYATLDKRLREELPDAFKAQEPLKRKQTVAGGTRTTGTGKRIVKLSPTEQATAKRLGVSLEAYARQKAAIAASK